MFSKSIRMCLCLILYTIILPQSCTSEPTELPTLVLSSAGELAHSAVLVKRVHENLTLSCELRGEPLPRGYVWTFIADSAPLEGERPFKLEPAVGSGGSTLLKTDLQVSDSGRYTCSAPPFSVTKYILVTSERLYLSSSRFAHSEPRTDILKVAKRRTEHLFYERLNSISEPFNSIDKHHNSIDQHTPNKRRVLRSVDGNNNVYNQNDNDVISGRNNVFNGIASEITGNSNVINGNSCRVYGNNNVLNGNNNVLRGDNVVINGHNNNIHASNGVFNGDNMHK